jgi:hypothetical protein
VSLLRPKRRALPTVPLGDAVRGVAECPCKTHQGALIQSLEATPELILRVLEVGLEDEEVQVATAVSPDGKRFLHAFADRTTATEAHPEDTFIAVPAQRAFRMALANGNEGILITAGGGDAWTAVTADGVTRLLDKS